MKVAKEEGRTIETLIHEAVKRSLDYDESFFGAVEKGLADAQNGRFIEHSEALKFRTAGTRAEVYSMYGCGG